MLSNLIPTESPVVISETRQQQLLRRNRAAPRFLQGVYPFAGRGVFDLAPLNEALSYTVPAGKIVQIQYFRAGNFSDDILYLAVSTNGTPIRYFPVGPKSDNHVPLAIVEDHPAGTRIEICLAAPRGLTGTVVLDVGMVEIDAEEQS